MVPSAAINWGICRKISGQKIADLIESSIQKTIESDGVYEVEYQIETPYRTQHYEGRFFRIRKNKFACFVRNITVRKKGELLSTKTGTVELDFG